MNALLFYITLGLYSLATVSYLVYLVKPQQALGSAARWLISGGFLVHAAFTVIRYIEAGHTPITNLHESLSFFGLAIVGVFIAFERKYRVFILGAFVTPLALLLMLASSIYPSGIPQLPPALKSKWLLIHSSLAFISYAMFAVAFGAAIMYLIQQHFLKKKRLGSLYQKLPSLDVLDDINYRCLTFGFPLLTIAIITGAIWAETAWGTYWSWDPEGNLVAHHLVHLRRPAPRKNDHRLARQESRYSCDHRLLRAPVHLPGGESPSESISAQLPAAARRPAEMNIVVVGLSHKTASVDIREKVAFLPTQMDKPLRELVALPDITEGVIVSTCNRVEIYATTHDVAGGMATAEAVSRRLPQRCPGCPGAAPVQPLWRSSDPSRLPGRFEPRLHGGGRAADPRPDQDLLWVCCRVQILRDYSQPFPAQGLFRGQAGPHRNENRLFGRVGFLCRGGTGEKDLRRPDRQDRHARSVPAKCANWPPSTFSTTACAG